MKDEIEALKARVAELEKPRLYVLGLSDMGTQAHPFGTHPERLEFLAKQDDCFDDWYTLDVHPDTVDFCLAVVGSDAQEQLDELED